jgi:copper oxidase (laccase) domain-containing protein
LNAAFVFVAPSTASRQPSLAIVVQGKTSAAIGPAIQRCCYEVGLDVIDPFRQAFSFAADVLRAGLRSDKTYLDVAGTNLRLLAIAGVDRSNIFVCSQCTSCRNDLFFSHR